jgi:hypothetical protein
VVDPAVTVPSEGRCNELVGDEAIPDNEGDALSRKEGRTSGSDADLTVLKQEMADRLLSKAAVDVDDAE